MTWHLIADSSVTPQQSQDTYAQYMKDVMTMLKKNTDQHKKLEDIAKLLEQKKDKMTDSKTTDSKQTE